MTTPNTNWGLGKKPILPTNTPKKKNNNKIVVECSDNNLPPWFPKQTPPKPRQKQKQQKLTLTPQKITQNIMFVGTWAI